MVSQTTDIMNSQKGSVAKVSQQTFLTSLAKGSVEKLSSHVSKKGFVENLSSPTLTLWNTSHPLALTP